MVQKLTNKLTNRKKDNKGFTLVELIVVIVILAILAAILIPGLLKWIDKAKEEQYTLEARNIYLATQAEVAKLYAADSTATKPATITPTQDIKDLAGVPDITSIAVTYKDDGSGNATWNIDTITTVFKSSDGNTISATMTGNKSWVINSITPPTT